MQDAHVAQARRFEVLIVERRDQRQAIGGARRGVAQARAFARRFGALAQGGQLARESRQLARDDGIEAGGFEIVVECERACRIGEFGQLLRGVDVESAVACLRPQVRREPFI